MRVMAAQLLGELVEKNGSMRAAVMAAAIFQDLKTFITSLLCLLQAATTSWRGSAKHILIKSVCACSLSISFSLSSIDLRPFQFWIYIFRIPNHDWCIAFILSFTSFLLALPWHHLLLHSNFFFFFFGVFPTGKQSTRKNLNTFTMMMVNLWHERNSSCKSKKIWMKTQFKVLTLEIDQRQYEANIYETFAAWMMSATI